MRPYEGFPLAHGGRLAADRPNAGFHPAPTQIS